MSNRKKHIIRKPPPPVSWKFIFNSSLSLYFIFDYARQAAKNADYPFFTWNDKIYETGTGKDTGINMTEYDY
jgi:hypothetical protein